MATYAAVSSILLRMQRNGILWVSSHKSDPVRLYALSTSVSHNTDVFPALDDDGCTYMYRYYWCSSYTTSHDVVRLTFNTAKHRGVSKKILQHAYLEVQTKVFWQVFSAVISSVLKSFLKSIHSGQ